jgi:hypothetical protein
LDSYLGYFGKTIVDGTAASDASGLQDIILLVAMGLSVLIGVFASQLAGETWETVLEEVEAEKREKEGEPDQDDGIMRQFLNVDLPDWLIGFQIALAMADDRIHEMIYNEYDGRVWNYTKKEPVPRDLDPAFYPTSSEIVGANRGFDFSASVCDGLVLTPALLETFFLYADPLLDEEKAKSERRKPREFLTLEDTKELSIARLVPSQQRQDDSQEALLDKLEYLRSRTRERLNKLNERLREDEL